LNITKDVRPFSANNVNGYNLAIIICIVGDWSHVNLYDTVRNAK